MKTSEIDILTTAANMGHVQSQDDLGVIYMDGINTEEDIDEASKYFMQAAEEGHIESQYIVDTMFKEVAGYDIDIYDAINYFKKAAVLGSTNSEFALGLIYADEDDLELHDYNEAAYWYEKAANNGNTNAQFNLAIMYEGVEGFTEDINKALVLYEKAAIKDVDAQYRIGEIYFEDNEAPRDYHQAHKWFTIAELNEYDIEIFIMNALDLQMSDKEIIKSKQSAQDWIDNNFQV
ncbi:MAG: TPR repeat protein [Gammaproteobacteria bacterium]|jgi:TPR repeat protein